MTPKQLVPALLIRASHLPPSFIVSGQVDPSSVSNMPRPFPASEALQALFLLPHNLPDGLLLTQLVSASAGRFFSLTSPTSLISPLCSWEPHQIFVFLSCTRSCLSSSLLHLLHLGYNTNTTVGAESMHKWWINIDCPKQNWFLV